MPNPSGGRKGQPHNMQTSKRVYAWMKEHARNELVHYADVAEATGLTGSQVNSSLNSFCVRHPEMGIVRGGTKGFFGFQTGLVHTTDRSGNQGTTQPPKSDEWKPDLWEELGDLNGRTLVRNSQGKLKFLADE